MSEVKVNKITPTTNCGTVTLGDSGDTIAIPAGVTLTSGGALQNSGTITNTGTITGVTITGTIDNQVNWQTGSIKTTGFTATAGEGYFVNTTSGAITATLPATPTVGDLVGIKDYAGTAATNNITLARNGSNIQGTANDFVINVAGTSVTFIYVDGTQGWVSTAASKASDITEQQLFVTATGGTITTSGDYKIHTFTGPGTFCVSCAGTAPGSNTVDYLVVAGGAGGAGQYGGGGGAGGYRESSGAASGCYSRSPLGACVSALPVSVQGYPITVGGGGAGNPITPNFAVSSSGANSIFSTITSAGGGFASSPGNAGSGGSGGGAGRNGSTPNVGAGNTPPVSPPQGNPGGPKTADDSTGSGGGGAGGAGGANIAAPSPSAKGGDGGPGVASSITGSPVTRAGGGGGGTRNDGTQGSTANGVPNNPGSGGPGGGGNGGYPGPNNPSPQAGTANTGGGGGAGWGGCGSDSNGSNGGSGIVIIRYKFQ